MECRRDNEDARDRLRSEIHPIAHSALWGIAIFAIGVTVSFLLHAFLPSGAMGADAYLVRQSSRSFALLALAALGFAPWMEAAIAQLLPIELMRRCRIPNLGIIVVCGLLFGAGHYFSNGLLHGVKTGIDGMLYAVVYQRVRERSAVHAWLTAAGAHFTNNLCALAIMLAMKYVS